MNFGYSYPLFRADHPDYNQPLVSAVRAAAETRGRAVRLVDVGAAIGDTVLLIEEKLGADVLAGVVCVDGDSEFAGYLRSNLAHRGDVHVVETMLSRSDDHVRSLVRTHAGTASAQGEATVVARTLDDVLLGLAFVPDLVKVDTDGFDGAILSGATRTLREHGPDVVFEWHPRLLGEAGNPLLESFEVLRSVGYVRFSMFDRYGHEVSVPPDDDALRALAAQCRTTGDRDHHFDVVART
jgi:FkbM family methyltransferase